MPVRRMTTKIAAVTTHLLIQKRASPKRRTRSRPWLQTLWALSRTPRQSCPTRSRTGRHACWTWFRDTTLSLTGCVPWTRRARLRGTCSSIASYRSSMIDGDQCAPMEYSEIVGVSPWGVFVSRIHAQSVDPDCHEAA